jgi:acetyltransferase
VLKPGRSREGAKASAFHTGSHATDHVQIEDALRWHGIPRALEEDEFLNALRALVMLPRPRGRRVGVATTSGALGVIATDLLVENGLELASFEPATLAQMRSILPDWLAPGNADFAEFGELMRRLRGTHAKPVAVVIYGGEARRRWTASLEGANIPIFPTTRAAVRALALMAEATL